MRYLIVLLLAGCSTTWRHETKSNQEFHQDAFNCSRAAAASVPRGGLPEDLQRNRMEEQCMRAQGWVSE